MQYTGLAFAHPLARVGAPILRERASGRAPAGPFPPAAEHAVTVGDPAEAAVARLLKRAELRVRGLRWLQQGRVQLYILYIAIALVGLVAWTFAAPGAGGGR
jgi:hypothetical protein